MDGSALRILSKKMAGTFIRRHPGAKRLKEELEQEACVAILLKAPSYRPGTQTLESYCYLSVLNAMQQHCARLGAIVGRSRNDQNRDFLASHSSADALDTMTYAPPQEEVVAAREASEVVSQFIDTRLARVGSKVPRATLKQMFTNLALGDTLTEAGALGGITRQRMQQLTDKVGLGDLC